MTGKKITKQTKGLAIPSEKGAPTWSLHREASQGRSRQLVVSSPGGPHGWLPWDRTREKGCPQGVSRHPSPFCTFRGPGMVHLLAPDRDKCSEERSPCSSTFGDSSQPCFQRTITMQRQGPAYVKLFACQVPSEPTLLGKTAATGAWAR